MQIKQPKYPAFYDDTGLMQRTLKCIINYYVWHKLNIITFNFPKENRRNQNGKPNLHTIYCCIELGELLRK